MAACSMPMQYFNILLYKGWFLSFLQKDNGRSNFGRTTSYFLGPTSLSFFRGHHRFNECVALVNNFGFSFFLFSKKKYRFYLYPDFCVWNALD